MLFVSLICFITPAVGEFTHNASRPCLTASLECWENSVDPREMLRSHRARMRGRRGAGRNITTETTQRVTVSCRWQAPSVACLTPEGQGTEEGVGRPRLSVSRSFQRPWPPQEKTHPVRMSVFHARLPPQLPPAPPFSAWLLIILNAVVN